MSANESDTPRTDAEAAWSIKDPCRDDVKSAVNIDFARQLERENAELRAAAEKALHEMCNTTAPRASFTDAVDALDAALNPSSRNAEPA